MPLMKWELARELDVEVIAKRHYTEASIKLSIGLSDDK